MIHYVDELDPKALEKKLEFYEEKYGLKSEVFYSKYISGEEFAEKKQTGDYREWADMYEHWLSRQVESLYR